MVLTGMVLPWSPVFPYRQDQLWRPLTFCLWANISTKLVDILKYAVAGVRPGSTPGQRFGFLQSLINVSASCCRLPSWSRFILLPVTWMDAFFPRATSTAEMKWSRFKSCLGNTCGLHKMCNHKVLPPTPQPPGPAAPALAVKDPLPAWVCRLFVLGLPRRRL